MHPYFALGPLALPAYGLALALAFAVGIAIARRRAREAGLRDEPIVEACLAILVSSLVGSRMLYLATHPTELSGSWRDGWGVLASDTPLVGLSMMGGVALAALAAVGVLVWRRMPVLQTTDVMAPSVVLGEAITRVGCFLNGCCFGMPCDYAWCVRFPNGGLAHVALGPVDVHPTQLYTSALSLAAFFALSRLLRARPPAGSVLFAFLVWEGALRSTLDTLRWEDAGEVLALGGVTLPHSTWLGLAFIAAGIGGLAWPRRETAARS